MKRSLALICCGPLLAAFLLPTFAKATVGGPWFAKATVGGPTFAEATVDGPRFAEATVGGPTFAKATVGRSADGPSFLIAAAGETGATKGSGGESAPAPAQAATAAAAAVPAAAPSRVEAAFKPQLSYGDQLLAEDTVWRGEVLVEGTVTVAAQATLTVEPGTVVRFKRSEGHTPILVVQGRIEAAGTKEDPIRFTSSFATSAAGDWLGITLLGSEKRNVLENCRIDGAQTGLEALFSNLTLKGVRAERCAVGMRFQDALVQMEAGGASDCDSGLIFANSEATLRGLNVVGNRVGISALKSSIYLEDGSLAMNRSALSCDMCRVKLAGGAALDNGRGVTLLESEGSVSGMKLARNSDYGLSLTGSRVRVEGNLITGNGMQGMLVFDGAGVAWNNIISGNSGHDIYNAGTEEFRAPGNFWGESVPRIYDNGGRGKVNIVPQLKTAPSRN
ncbi:right-handed parallel beta-helix repeat-containing protein [Geomonas subterranea]|uniref:Right-handed parallel beta-helix repeat-containing protein n=1 Tax=Geomonas subterranea TaxID=2847989 RepID=A0ABX8LG51_9BACT|nr:right-handed parallel beta-helix repeat-containing protein [Geomonas subterranea]QXE91010.1 right-handed parallel beta-helix repeat-containing protein [Geomonas subterranea]QXM10905.1 right-handed parallel beta-helix repeat-containing protein [Geomonas subterranea]